MDISVTRKIALVLVCLLLFSTCGELDTLFPSNNTYQVKALVNGNSLEDCSITRTNDKIQPYFASSVINDPDLIGLLVYLQDSQGNIVGKKLQYTLLPYADDTALTEEEFSELEESDLEEETGATKIPEPDETGGAEYQILEQWSIADFIPAEKNTDVEIAVKSLSQKLPNFSLPNDLEIGPYVLVFEVVGKRDTLSRMETDIYYLGSAEFNLKDISMSLPGLYGPQLISPETVILLEASLDFDSRLDPYLIWYNGKNIIGEGKISEGAEKLLWKAPKQPGFYSLRLEALPLPLNRGVYTGISRGIALPVSPKTISLSYFFGNNNEYTALNHLELESATLLQWYQFDGSLSSSQSALIEEQTLLPVNKTSPRWAATGQSYGLAIGPDDPYQLSPINFFYEETDLGGGILLLHIKPLTEGSIFSAFFPFPSQTTAGISMDVIKKDNDIALCLTDAFNFIELPLNLTFSAMEEFIPIAVEFYIRPHSFEAKISMDVNHQSQVGEIKLSDTLSGEGKFRLGGGQNNEETFTDTIWDELAILYSAVPLLRKDPPKATTANEAIEIPQDTDEEQGTQEFTTLTVSSENL